MLKKGDTLVIASHNAGKIAEIADLLEPLGFHVISAAAMGLPEPEETGATFVENAQLKAITLAKASGHMALADDSGLSVDALGGQPGIYSARWAEKTPGGPRDFNRAFDRLFSHLDPQLPHAAQMNCVLSLADPEGVVYHFEGIVHGTISLPPRGHKGFGYDPIFTPQGYSQTFGEMEPEFKAKISHRQDAFTKFLTFLNPPQRKAE